jgi:hypothetical protein
MTGIFWATYCGHLISFLYNYLQYELHHEAKVGNNMGHMIITGMNLGESTSVLESISVADTPTNIIVVVDSISS